MIAACKWVELPKMFIGPKEGYYVGVVKLKPNDLNPVWTCEHRHKDGLNATECAEKHLRNSKGK